MNLLKFTGTRNWRLIAVHTSTSLERSLREAMCKKKILVLELWLNDFMRCFHILYSKWDKSVKKTRRKREDVLVLHDVVPLQTSRKKLQNYMLHTNFEFWHFLGTFESTQLRNSFLWHPFRMAEYIIKPKVSLSEKRNMNRLTRKLNKLILQLHRSYHADLSLSTIFDRKKK